MLQNFCTRFPPVSFKLYYNKNAKGYINCVDTPELVKKDNNIHTLQIRRNQAHDRAVMGLICVGG